MFSKNKSGEGTVSPFQAATAASISALIAKENLVSTFGVLYGLGDASEKSVTMWSGFAGMFTDAGGILHVGAMCAFVAFNMLDAPCFAAVRPTDNATYAASPLYRFLGTVRSHTESTHRGTLVS